MKKIALAVLFALVLSTAPAAWASPPGPCDCVSCLLEPDRLCTEPFTLVIKTCREFSADRCPVASALQPQATAQAPACREVQLETGPVAERR
jgi:hypothetical protein